MTFQSSVQGHTFSDYIFWSKLCDLMGKKDNCIVYMTTFWKCSPSWWGRTIREYFDLAAESGLITKTYLFKIKNKSTKLLFGWYQAAHCKKGNCSIRCYVWKCIYYINLNVVSFGICRRHPQNELHLHKAHLILSIVYPSSLSFTRKWGRSFLHCCISISPR